MAKHFYCYVFEMTTERIVSSYVINERNKKGGGGGNEDSILDILKQNNKPRVIFFLTILDPVLYFLQSYKH